ncbi:hypothetical protein [Streptomyces sp. NBC_01237]|nr:hypothetical protein [Streptomyces sp. NBC_01237]WRZ77292.1 hypothetical protein OG251_37190 [Streptomyces sp. NBC_01237]
MISSGSVGSQSQAIHPVAGTFAAVLALALAAAVTAALSPFFT